MSSIISVCTWLHVYQTYWISRKQPERNTVSLSSAHGTPSSSIPGNVAASVPRHIYFRQLLIKWLFNLVASRRCWCWLGHHAHLILKHFAETGEDEKKKTHTHTKPAFHAFQSNKKCKRFMLLLWSKWICNKYTFITLFPFAAVFGTCIGPVALEIKWKYK